MKKLAIYLRLSMEDNDRADESSSITNQRLLLKEFLRGKPEFSDYEILEYCDDGYSGTSFERPGVAELLCHVKQHLVGCIVVKDFSRFSRNYIEIGDYLDQIFPFMGIRFISVSDNYDSDDHKGITTEIDTAFKILLNDFYSKDLSLKVKTSKRSKCNNGEFVFGQPPLGYEKIHGERNQVRVNEREAEIVRHIFELSARGISDRSIAKRLHEEKIPTCRQLRRKGNDDGGRKCWSGSRIRRILNNRFYIGEFTHNMWEPISVGSSKMRPLPENEWITLPDHHEPIITQELFTDTRREKHVTIIRKQSSRHPLTGKLYCGGCGYAMSHSGLQHPSFQCKKKSLLGNDTCCSYIREDIMEELVISVLNRELAKLADLKENREAVRDSLKSRIGLLEEKIRNTESRKKESEQETVRAYEKYADGEIGPEEYKNKVSSIGKSIAKKAAAIEKYQKDLSLTEKAYLENCESFSKVLNLSGVSGLTPEVVDDFIQKIKVHKDKKVEIEWKFQWLD